MKKSKKRWAIVSGFLLILIIAAVVAVRSMSAAVPTIQINDIDLKSIADGTYKGECDAALVKAAVTVQIKDNKIIEIKIDEHKNGLGKKAEKITDEIIKQQSLRVDVIGGATTSSEAILKAVENALSK